MAPVDLISLVRSDPRPEMTLFLADGRQYNIAPTDVAHVIAYTLFVGRDLDDNGWPRTGDYIDGALVVQIHVGRVDIKER